MCLFQISSFRNGRCGPSNLHNRTWHLFLLPYPARFHSVHYSSEHVGYVPSIVIQDTKCPVCTCRHKIREFHNPPNRKIRYLYLGRLFLLYLTGDFQQHPHTAGTIIHSQYRSMVILRVGIIVGIRAAVPMGAKQDTFFTFGLVSTDNVA